MTTIASLAVTVGMNAKPFVDGAVLTKKEMREVSRIMEQARTPAEKIAEKIVKLGELYSKGALTNEAYTKTVKSLKEQYRELTGESKKATEAAEKQAAAEAKAAKESARHAAAMKHAAQAAESYRKRVHDFYNQSPLEESSADIRGRMGGGAAAVAARGNPAAAALAATATVAGAGVAKLISDANQFVEVQANVAARLGVTTAAIQGFTLAANTMGTSGDVAVAALEKMNVFVGKAASGNKEASAAIAKLGLDVQALANQGAVATFGDIADAISQLPTVSERAAAAVEIFGRSGSQLGELLAGGSAAIADVTEKMREFGAVSEYQANAIREANDAWDEATAAISGFGQQLAASNSQLKTEVADGIALFAGYGTSILGFLSETSAGFQELWSEAFGGRTKFDKEYDAMGKGLNTFAMAAELAAESQSTVTDAVKETAEAVKEQASEGAIAYERLREQVETLGMTAGQKLLREIEQSNPVFLDRARQLQAEVEAFEAQEQARKEAESEAKRAADEAKRTAEQERKQMEDFGERLKEQVETPAETIVRKKAEIDEAFSAGVIDSETYRKAIAGLEKELPGGQGIKGGAAGAGLARGSQEAFQAEQTYRNGQPDKSEEFLRIIAGLSREQADANRELLNEWRTFLRGEPVA